MKAPPGTCAGSTNQPGVPEWYQSSAIDQRPTWCSTATSPISPASMRALSMRLRSRISPWNGTHTTPAASTASTIASACAIVIAMGLPITMCLPARAAAMVSAGMSQTGVAMCTMSTSGRAMASS